MLERISSAMSGRSWKTAIALALIAFLLRLPGHLNSGLWFDEIWLLTETIRSSFGSLVTTFASDNNHPLYSLFTWVSVQAFGEAPWALRLPAVLFGGASIGMLWWFSMRVTTAWRAGVVTLLMTLSYHHVWFSQNARGYTMLLFWTLAATHFLLADLRGEGRRAWVGYGLTMALATYTHSSAVFVAVAHGLVMIGATVWPAASAPGDRRNPKWTPFAGLALAGGVSLLLHAAILPDMLEFFRGDPAAAPSPGEGVESEWNSPWWTIQAVAESLGLGLPIGLVALGVAGFTTLVGVARFVRDDVRVAALFVLPAVIGVGATMALGRPVRPRFLFNLGGFILLIVVTGTFETCALMLRGVAEAHRPIWTRRMERLAAASMVALFLLILPRAYTMPKQDFEGAYAAAEALRSAGHTVAITGLTVLPYDDYYEAGYPEIGSVEELDRLARETPLGLYVLHTIPIYLESRIPDLAERLRDAPIEARFPGSLGAGDVLVLRIAP